MLEISQYSPDLQLKEGIWISPKTSEISYPKEGNEYCFQIEENSFWFRHRNNCIIELVKRYSPDKDFFDIGGGNGYVAKGLESAGIRSVLVEPGWQGCLNARTRNLQHVVCSTLENTGFRPNSLPSAGMFDVVEHIEDDKAFLSSVHYFLQRQGVAYFTVPAFQALWSDEDADAGHFRRYSVAQFRQKLEEVGFSVEYATYIFSILPLPVFMFRSLPTRLGIRRDSHNMNKHQADHNPQKGIATKVLESIWAYELNRIQVGKSLPIGGSCLVVARK